MGLGRSRLASSALGIGFVGAAGVMAVSCGVEGDPNWVPQTLANVDARVGADGRCVRPGPDGRCAPDPAPSLVRCDVAESGLEFLEPAVFDFEDAGATAMYSYSDNSSEFLQPNGYQPDLFTGNTRCGIDPDGDGVLEPDPSRGNGELHLWGGPFREWGGGLGRSLQGYAQSLGCVLQNQGGFTVPTDDGTGPCPPLDPRIEMVQPVSDVLTANDPAVQLRAGFYQRTLDAREWDGISFWARRGPGSDEGFRVALGDRQLDDDVSFLEAEAYKLTNGAAPGPMCGRVLECGCRNHRPCTPDPGGLGSYCWDPERGDPSPSELLMNPPPGVTYIIDEFPYNFPYEECGDYECNLDNDSFTRADLIFTTPERGGTASCQPYTFDNDFTDYHCYDPNDPPNLSVAPQFERCGDVWNRPVFLTQEWQFFKVPFSELRQEGWGKEFQYLDISRLALVRFTWAVGWIDFWLDDVRFYRRAPAAAN